MNKFAALIIAFFCIGKSICQDSGEIKNSQRNDFFYFSPAELFFNTFQLGYERKLKCNNTIAVFGGFKLSQSNQVIERIGGSGEIQYRVNLLYNKEAVCVKNKNCTSFAYFAPYLQYKYEDIRDPDYSDFTAKSISTYVNSAFGGLGFGLRITGLENRFCANIFAGGGMKYSEIKGNSIYSDFFEVGYTGIAPKLALQLGIAF